jgi:IS5 family transposase
MAKAKFIETGGNSFFGTYIYDQIVPHNHFFRKLNEIIDWQTFTKKLLKLYRGGAEYGRPPFDPALILKMLLVAYLYDISERQVEDYINYYLPAKYFLGIAVDQQAPDHSTLSKFKKRLIDNQNLVKFEELLAEIVSQALETGVAFGSIQIMDSVHSVANVNTGKDEGRKGKGAGPRDPDAKWGVKHTRKVKDEEGKTHQQREYFYGYKAHISLNAENGLVTSVVVTPGNAYDGHRLPELLEQDLAHGVPFDTVAADRGYDDGNNHFLLQSNGLHSAIRLNDYRTQKKDKNKQVWFELLATSEYQQGCKERYKIERKFGEAKQSHGLGRCRYVSLSRFWLQAILTAIALNLKRLVKILCGVRFKNGTLAAA